MKEDGGDWTRYDDLASCQGEAWRCLRRALHWFKTPVRSQSELFLSA